MPPIFNKTWGGSQFWGDVHFFRGWKIQQNIYTRHYRLLDPQNYRFESGTLAACLETLEQIKQQQELSPMSGTAVVLVHGITRSTRYFSRLKTALKRDGCTFVNFEYPSTRVNIETSADYLRQTIASLTGVDTIHFVVHSMGGIVVRTLLKTVTDPRISRLVMLGVPNTGAQFADRLKQLGLFKLIYGPAGQQLVTDMDGYIAALPIPHLEFAIIAGGRGDAKGYNPLIDGDDDGVVTVESARLPGAADFSLVPCIHSLMPSNEEVCTQTIRFLRTGCLRASGERCPIPR